MEDDIPLRGNFRPAGREFVAFGDARDIVVRSFDRLDETRRWLEIVAV